MRDSLPPPTGAVSPAAGCSCEVFPARPCGWWCRWRSGFAEGPPVGGGSGARGGVETAPEVDRGGEADPGGDRFDRQVGLLQQGPGRGDALAEQPLAGAGAELFGEPAGQGPGRHPGARCEPAEGQLCVESLGGPLEHRRQGLGGPEGGGVSRTGAGRLPGAAAHHAAGDLVGYAAPWSPRTRCRHRSMPAAVPALVGEVAVVHVQHVGVDLDCRVALPQLGGVAPVRGGPAAVEQPGLGQDEGPGADRDDPGPAPVDGPQRPQDGRRTGPPVGSQPGTITVSAAPRAASPASPSSRIRGWSQRPGCSAHTSNS